MVAYKNRTNPVLNVQKFYDYVNIFFLSVEGGGKLD